MFALRGWTDFYVIVGSSAGALIGLQFVVMSLIAQVPTALSSGDARAAASAFGTPTVVHFGTALLLAALLAAPWSAVSAAPLAWGIVGAAGLAYEIAVGLRMRRQSGYAPILEDWLLYLAAPLAAYAALVAMAILARSHLSGALDGVAAATLGLLFIGIRNAWDTVTYHVYSRRRPS